MDAELDDVVQADLAIDQDDTVVETEFLLDDADFGMLTREVLTDRDVLILAALAQHPRGVAVPDAVVGLFESYRTEGLVTLLTCVAGPARQPVPNRFWARITPLGEIVISIDTPLQRAA